MVVVVEATMLVLLAFLRRLRVGAAGEEEEEAEADVGERGARREEDLAWVGKGDWVGGWVGGWGGGEGEAKEETTYTHVPYAQRKHLGGDLHFLLGAGTHRVRTGPGGCVGKEEEEGRRRDEDHHCNEGRERGGGGDGPDGRTSRPRHEKISYTGLPRA